MPIEGIHRNTPGERGRNGAEYAMAPTLGLLLVSATAQTRKPGSTLDTGFERNLGVVYKTVGKRQLEFDLYYPATGTTTPWPDSCAIP